jgi:hypothetical protein
MTRHKVPRRVFWPLMIASGAAVGAAYAVTRIGAVVEWLRWGPAPVAPATDWSDRKPVHPGEPPFGASDFGSMDNPGGGR